MKDSDKVLAHPADTHLYITTRSGLRLALPDLEVQDCRPTDIVHSLALQCRYMGHCREFYSVAEHSVLVCALAERDHGFGSEVARAALLHDAAEAFTGDHPSPFKKIVPGLKAFEAAVEAPVYRALRLPPPTDAVWEEVKKYDLYALFQEAAQLFTPAPPWVQEVPRKYLHPIHCLAWRDAELRMLLRLREYGYHV